MDELLSTLFDSLKYHISSNKLPLREGDYSREAIISYIVHWKLCPK